MNRARGVAGQVVVAVLLAASFASGGSVSRAAAVTLGSGELDGGTLGVGIETSTGAKHRFSTKGAHSLSVASVWRATATMIGPGGAVPIPIDIATAVLTATVAYPVVEVRSRLVS